MYIEHLLEVMDEVWRVLRDDGSLWLNIADSYAGSGQGWQKDHSTMERRWLTDYNKMRPPNYISSEQNGVKPKDLYGIPWMLAFALRAKGWYLRSSIIWAKPAPIPESVRDRCTRSYEYIFMFTKKADYYYDHVAIAEPALRSSIERDLHGYKHAFMTQFAGSPDDKRHPEGKVIEPTAHATRNKRNVWLVPKDIDIPFNHWLADKIGLDAFKELVEEYLAGQDNAQDVWWINTRGNPLKHFATFPEALVEPCILAGTSEKGCCSAKVKRLRIKDYLTPDQKERVEQWLSRKGLI
jgi:DNA modification methylase